MGVDVLSWFVVSDFDFDWLMFQVFGVWEGQGLVDVDGVVWMCKCIEFKFGQVVGVVELYLVKVDDCDEVWVNGQKVGGQCGWEQVCYYVLLVGLLCLGVNWIVVWVIDIGGGGGIYGEVDDLCLDMVVGLVLFVGVWCVCVEKFVVVSGLVVNNVLVLGYNGLIVLLQGLLVCGVFWY